MHAAAGVSRSIHIQETCDISQLSTTPMAFELQPLTTSDAARCVEIYFAAFQNAHSIATWPRIPTVRQWWENMIRDELTEDGAHWLKAVSPETGEIAGYCKWRRFKEGHQAGTSLPEWPEGSDKDLANETFGAWAFKHPELMGSRAHWCM
jgi:hypothetical protein